jgi:HAD superfamily hydrolase (TIGR01509 family)
MLGPGRAVRLDPAIFCTWMNMTETTAKPAAMIFDLDDTLVATARHWRAAESHLLEQLGRSWSPELAATYKGMNTRDVAATIHRALRPAMSLHDAQRVLRDDLIARFVSDPPPPMPGAVALVQQLSGNYRLAVASGSPPAAIVTALRSLGIADRFVVVISSESVARGKPEPDVFLAAASRLGVEPGRCLVFEDSLVGVQAARAAGMACVAIPSGDHESIAATGTRVFESLAVIGARNLTLACQ